MSRPGAARAAAAMVASARRRSLAGECIRNPLSMSGSFWPTGIRFIVNCDHVYRRRSEMWITAIDRVRHADFVGHASSRVCACRRNRKSRVIAGFTRKPDSGPQIVTARCRAVRSGQPELAGQERVPVGLGLVGHLMIGIGVQLDPRMRRMLGKRLPDPGADEDVLTGPLEQFVTPKPGHVPDRLEASEDRLVGGGLVAGEAQPVL